MSQQQLSVVTLGTTDLARSRRFYVEGFGWAPVHETPDIVFYQMYGMVLGTFRLAMLEEDMQRGGLARPGAFSLAHNVTSGDQVMPLIERLVAAGGTLLRSADAPPHGGLRGYVADPDDHAWEIAWQPGFKIADDGRVTFGV